MTPVPRAGIEQIFAAFAARLELEDFSFTEDGHAMLAFDGTVVDIEIQEAEAQVLVSALLGENIEEEAGLLGQLLEANYLWAATAGATVSRAPGQGPFVLHQALSTWTLDADRLAGQLGAFVDAAEALSAMIAQGSLVAAAATGEEPSFEVTDPGAIRV